MGGGGRRIRSSRSALVASDPILTETNTEEICLEKIWACKNKCQLLSIQQLFSCKISYTHAKLSIQFWICETEILWMVNLLYLIPISFVSHSSILLSTAYIFFSLLRLPLLEWPCFQSFLIWREENTNLC